MSAARPCSAGIYEQSERGWRLVEWSRHRTPSLAAAAARRYQRRLRAPTGGALTWSAWWRAADDHPEHEVGPDCDRDHEVPS